MLKVIRHRHSFVGYTFVITKDGIIHQTRKLSEIGAHVISMNDRSIGICIVGNFDRLLALPNSKPTKKQEESLKKLLKELSLKHNIKADHIVGHRHFATYKTCPGRNLSDSYGQDLVRENTTSNATNTTLIQEKLDIITKIIATLRLLVIRLQNKLGGKNYV